MCDKSEKHKHETEMPAHEHESCCCCCGEHINTSEVPSKGLTSSQRKNLIRIITSLLFLLLIKLTETHFMTIWKTSFGLSDTSATQASYFTNIILYGATYIFIGHKVLLKAFRNICKGKIFDENFLMVVATLGAIFMGVMGDGEFSEAVAVMIFYQLGEWFEGYAVGKSKKSITDLMDIRPDHANIERGGKIVEVDPSTLEIGSIIIVRPGEKIPIDGIVTQGASSLDTSALTGESVPKTVRVGDEVISGCICKDAVLKIKTTKHFSESTVSKILDLVENASEKKSHSEAFISRFAKYYTPIVCACALCLAIIPPIIFIAIGQSPNWMDWIYRALIFLVISCPCALVISIPLSFYAGIGCASKNGVLVKGSNYLEAMSKVHTIMFDKTGTLTCGVFEVTDVLIFDENIIDEAFKNVVFDIDLSCDSFIKTQLSQTQKNLLCLAAHAESASSHPIAKSIVSTLKSQIQQNSIANQAEVSAQGVSAEVFGHTVKVGKPEFVSSDKPFNKTHEGGSTVYVSVDNTLAGSITISDVVKETSHSAILKLKHQGVAKTVMLTGDNEQTAMQIAKEIGIDEVYANLLPEQKVEHVEKTQKSLSAENKIVGFVGDGINDAPVLMRADVGIAMGAMGSDAAIEAADIVLMDDNPLSISKSLSISKKSMRIVKQNIVFSLSVKAICLILGAVGIANMYLAIFADVGVMVIAVLNAMRALRIKL